VAGWMRRRVQRGGFEAGRPENFRFTFRRHGRALLMCEYGPPHAELGSAAVFAAEEEGWDRKGEEQRERDSSAADEENKKK